MSAGRNYTPKDYLALGLALLLAFGVWFIHNLSLNYSGLVQCSFAARCDLPGHSDVSSNSADVAARCNMSGFDILSYAPGRKRSSGVVVVSAEDLKSYGGDLFYMTKENLSRYFHEFFGDKSTLEYFVTDTVFFRFPFEEYRKVPLRPVSSISFRAQYMASGELRLTPDSVLVYGNRDMLEGIHEVKTELIGFQDVNSSVVGEVSLERIPGVRMSAERVRFELPVSRYVEHTLKALVTPLNFPSNVSARFFPSSAVVRLRTLFPGEDDFSDISVYVDFNEFETSMNGKCLGRISGLPSGVLGYVLEPEVFDCVTQVPLITK